MVKQILLGIAVVGGEVFLNEGLQLLRGGIAAGEVELAQGFYDPGIKWEGLGMGVGEEEDAVSNLGADAGKALELGLGGFIIQGGDGWEIDLVLGDHRGGGVEVFGAVTHAAVAQVGLGQ